MIFTSSASRNDFSKLFLIASEAFVRTEPQNHCNSLVILWFLARAGMIVENHCIPLGKQAFEKHGNHNFSEIIFRRRNDFIGIIFIGMTFSLAK